MLVETPTLAQAIAYGHQQLMPSSDSAKLDAQLLLASVLDKELSYLLTWPEKVLSKAQRQAFLSLLSRRIEGEPIAYILGFKEFWSLPFKVSTATLIPRPDTETLIELVLAHFAEKALLSCLDLGTGTGAIALSLASEMPTWHIDALDFSEEAVALAKFNAKQLNLPQVNIYQSDWFEKVPSNSQFDLIVSNPPYIDGDDVNLSQGDVRFEPKSALVANNNGLADIEHIAKQAKHYLKPQGRLYFEHGYQQGAAVRALLENLGYRAAQTVTDLNGHERISWAIFSHSHE